MPPAGFEPAIPARERPQTNAFARAATANGCPVHMIPFYFTTLIVFTKANAFMKLLNMEFSPPSG